MKIKIAKTAGFCMGVKRAVDLAVDTSAESGSNVWTLGPLIHNEQTIETLRGRGVKTLTAGEPAPKGSSVLIRAHGVPPDVQTDYTNQGHALIDGTCPKVKTVHKVIERHRSTGFQIVIAGDEGHAEVIGLMGYAGEAGHLIQSVEDIAALPDFDKVCLVAQTTFDRLEFDNIAEAMQQRYEGKQVVVKKTICSATRLRQNETRQLAATVDAMIVVGGKHSANTLRLAKISKECGALTQHVETEQEIDWEPLAGCETIGITAGASTPHWMIKRVSDHLQFLSDTRSKTPRNILWQLLDIAANLNIIIALGGVAIYYASCVLQGFPFTFVAGAISFLYFLSMYLWNSLTNVDLMRHHGISRYQFYNAHKKLLQGLAVVCIGLIWWISWGQSWSVFSFMLFLTIAGSLYHFTIVPKPLQRFIRARNLKDIPTSRDVLVALAWAVLTSVLPHLLTHDDRVMPISVFFFAWTFVLAFLRSLMFDLRDIEGDRIMGRETLVTLIGEKLVRRTIDGMIVGLLVAVLVFTILWMIPTHDLSNARTIALLLQIPVLGYMYGFMRFGRTITFNRASLFNLLADTQFYLAGIGCWLSVVLLRG